MSEQSQGTWLTQEAYDRLSAELEHRKTTERKEIAQRVEAARQEGDLRENAGYHAAREEAGLNEARIIQLEETLENAQIGEAADDGSVSAGTIVTAKVAGKEQVFALGGQEITADVPDGVKVFSPDAPLGQALMGHRAGDTVSYEAPTGREIKAEIVKVERVWPPFPPPFPPSRAFFAQPHLISVGRREKCPARLLRYPRGQPNPEMPR